MAKAWKAATKIQYGHSDGTIEVFEAGDIVTIDDNKEMAALWEAGALEETTVADSEPKAVEPASTAPQGEVVKVEGGGTEGTPNA